MYTHDGATPGCVLHLAQEKVLLMPVQRRVCTPGPGGRRVHRHAGATPGRVLGVAQEEVLSLSSGRLCLAVLVMARPSERPGSLGHLSRVC